MNDEADGMSSAFHRWQRLTDAYAEQLEALRRNEPGATAMLRRICRDLERCQTGMKEQGNAGPN